MPTDNARVAKILERHVPKGVRNFLTLKGMRFYVLGKREQYIDASPGLKRLGVNVDHWPAPPVGLCVVEDRAVYLRSISPICVVHEGMHLLDLARGGDKYFSSTDAEFKCLFAAAAKFVTPNGKRACLEE